MKKLICKIILFLSLIISTFVLLYLYTALGLGTGLHTAYNYTINDKFKNLIDMKSPKIIFIAGSSGAFGIDPKTIKEETGYDCANIALHAGFGMKFQTELAKGNISKGDIVIIAYEPSQWSDIFYSAELIVTAIDDNVKLYKYVPKESYIDIIKYFPKYLFIKLDSYFYKPMDFTGAYNRSSFDKSGDLILDIPECVLPNPVPLNKDVNIILNKSKVSDKMIDYVNDFNDYVKSKGATLLISFPPLLNQAVISDKKDIEKFQSYLNKKLNAPIISNCEDYILKWDYFYDNVYHLNTKGKMLRTKLLTKDINKFLTNQK